MLSVWKLLQNGFSYYTELTRSKEDYYVNAREGEPNGIWWGRGATKLGLIGDVQEADLKGLFEGLAPTGERLRQIQKKQKSEPIAAFDCTFSAPKSISVCFAQADPAIQKEIRAAQAAAVAEGLRYLEDSAGYVRTGAGGVVTEKAGLAVATFEHATSRAQDCQLHTHAIVANAGIRENGRGAALDGTKLFNHKMAAGALYRAHLSAELERRLGFRLEREEWRFEISGVPKELIQEFSKRREEIESRLRKTGGMSARDAARAAQETRDPKEQIPREELFRRWQSVGREFGFTNVEVRSLLGAAPVRDPKEEIRIAMEAAIENLTAHESHFAERDLVRAVSEAAQGRGVTASEVRLAVWKELETEATIVQLGERRGEKRYTTHEMLETEQRMLAAVGRLHGQSTHACSSKLVMKALAEKPTTKSEQARALHHITAEPGAIKAIRGMAGTGKTSFVLSPAARVWKASGYAVHGAALSSKASKKLESETGIRCQNVHRTLSSLRSGELTFNPNTVLVIDEAGMVGTRQLEALISFVEESGAKAVLVGDERQLQPVEAGGPFAAVAELLDAPALVEISRQKEAWAKEAVRELAYGAVEKALQSFAENGCLHVEASREETVGSLVSKWFVESKGDYENSQIFVSTRLDSVVVNRACQEERLRAGELHSNAIRVGRYYLHTGDRILFTKNSDLVENGLTGTVAEITPDDRISVTLDRGETVLIDPKEYSNIELGYAVTTYKGQGESLKRTYALIGDEMLSREHAYTQLSRFVESTAIFTDEHVTGGDLAEFARKMALSRRKELASQVGFSPDLLIEH